MLATHQFSIFIAQHPRKDVHGINWNFNRPTAESTHIYVIPPPARLHSMCTALFTKRTAAPPFGYIVLRVDIVR